MPIPIFIPYGPFEPDSGDLNVPVLVRAKNVWPTKTCYEPVLETEQVGTAGSAGATVRGAALITTTAPAYSVYFGLQTSLRRTDSSNLNSNTSVGTGFTGPDAGDYWSFTRFGSFIIAVNENDNPQVADWVTPGSFGALSGSPPRAFRVFTIEDFVFLVGLASNRRKLQWSAINDHTGWTVGTGLSDEQEFPDGGDLYGIVGGKSGFVIQQNAIRRYQFLPGDTATIFQFDKIDGVPGCAGPRAWAKAGDSIIYYSEEGFCKLGPAGFQTIGAHRVDAYFKAFSPNTYSMQAMADPYNPRVIFAFHTSTGAYGRNLVYDWLTDKWSELDSSAVEGTQVNDTWIDAIEGTGGGGYPLYFNSSGPAIHAYKNTARTEPATLKMAEMEVFQSGPHKGQRALISAIRPETDCLVDGVSTGDVTDFTRNTLRASQTTTTSSTMESNGRFSLLASGAYHQFQVVSSDEAATVGTYHRGITIWADPAGEA